MKILVGIGVVILLLLILIIALPFLIDLNKYQDRYRPLIEEALNRNVELQDIRLTIWPRIGARIGGFVVQDDPSFRTGPFASLASLDVGVKLLPLLKGRVDVEEITLRDPVILVLKNSQALLTDHKSVLLVFVEEAMTSQSITIRGTLKDCWVINRIFSDVLPNRQAAMEDTWFDVMAGLWIVTYKEVSNCPAVPYQFVLRCPPVVC